MAIPAESFLLDPSAEGTLQVQIRQLVAMGIIAGRYLPGEKLPSSRKLAQHLGVSRITVTLAYTDLLADDYISSRGRSGYYVSANAPKPPDFPARQAGQGSVDWGRVLGQREPASLGVVRPADWSRYRYPFIYGQADPDLFDSTNWRLCALRALGKRDFTALTTDYYDGDDPKLVEVISRQILPRRGIQAAPDEILVTMGAQNALWLSAQVLLTQRRTAAIEDPSYPALRAVLSQSRCMVAPVKIDADGLPPSALPDDTDVVFVTPSHQCPTTVTMPVDRRRELLDRAQAQDFLIVEDDYEFEMSFDGPSSPALKSLDRDGRVIYVGSFSKSLFPGLRLGYLAGPAPFIREARNLRASVLRHPPGQMQRTASYFLSLGHYDALVRRTARTYQDRRNVLDAAITRHGLRVAGRGTYGGSSVWMQAPQGVDMQKVADRLKVQSVLIEPGGAFFAGPPQPQNYYRLAYSSIAADRIEHGVALIADALRTEQKAMTP